MPVTSSLSRATLVAMLGNDPLDAGYMGIGAVLSIKGGSTSGGVAAPGATVTGNGSAFNGPINSDAGMAIPNGQVWRNIGGFTTGPSQASLFQRVS